MKLLRTLGTLFLLITVAAAQGPTPSPNPPLLKQDDRLKVDLLLVVAHPDDETGVVPYLVQLIRSAQTRGRDLYNAWRSRP